MKTILVGTDFSLPARNAVNYAVELATFFSAKLILVNSFSLPIGGYDSAAPFEVIGALQDASQKGVEELKKDILNQKYDLEIECVSQVGTTFNVINDAAVKYSADLIVMGMVGEGSFVKRHLIGSAAISVSRGLSTPALIVPEAALYQPVRAICFACAPEDLEEEALIGTARHFTQVFHAALEIVTVEKADDKLERDETRAYTFIEKHLQGIKHKQIHIEDEDVSKALEYYFKFHKTDLVMVNPGKHNMLEKLFSPSITKTLAFSIGTPLLVIH